MNPLKSKHIRKIVAGIFTVSLAAALLTLSSSPAYSQSESNSGDLLCAPAADIDLLIMVDESGSMTADRRRAVRAALTAIGDELAKEIEGSVTIRLGLSSFRKNAITNPREAFSEKPLTLEDIAELTNGAEPESTNGTNYESAFDKAVSIFKQHSPDGNCRVLLFFTDGVAARVMDNNFNKAMPEGLNNRYAENQRYEACKAGGIADSLQDESIKTIAVMLQPSWRTDPALRYSLEMLLAITSEELTAPAVTNLSNELKANNTPLSMGDCAAYNSQNRDNEGQIISAANAPDVVNALLIPVFKLTQLDWADCPEVDADGEALTSQLPAGKFLSKLSIFVQGGELLGAYSTKTNKNLVDSSSGTLPRNLILGSQDLDDENTFPPGWQLRLVVRSLETEQVKLICTGSPRVLDNIPGIVQSGGEEIYAIGKTKSGDYEPARVEIVTPIPCEGIGTAIIKNLNWSGGPQQCTENKISYPGITLEDSIVSGASIIDSKLCIEPEYGEAVFPGDCSQDSSKWPTAEVNFSASVFEEGEVGVDCTAVLPEVNTMDQPKVVAQCILQQSDEADTTRFELSWNGGDAGPWGFENGEAIVEISKNAVPNNPYEISALYNPNENLIGEICVLASEIRQSQEPNSVDLPGTGNCVTIDFQTLAEEKLRSILECESNVVTLGNGNEVPDSPVKAKTSCRVDFIPNLSVQIGPAPANQIINGTEVQWGISSASGECSSIQPEFSGTIYLCSQNSLPNGEIITDLKFDLVASLSVNGILLVGEFEVETINAQLDYIGRSDVALAVILGVLLCLLMALLAYSIWVYAMKKASRFGTLDGLAYAKHEFKTTAQKDDFDNRWSIRANDLDQWIPDPNKDIAFPEEADDSKTMLLGSERFEARSARWWQPSRLAKGGWMHYERSGWAFRAKPVSPNDEGIAPLDFDSLVIVGIEKVTSDPSAVAFFILPVGEGMVEAISDQVEIAHDLLENLEDEFSIMEKQASASTELLDGPGSETVTDETGSGPPSGGPPSGGPPSGGPPSGGPPSGGPPSGGPPPGL